MFGVTPTGFVKKSFEIIKAEMESDARLAENYGADVDLSEFSPIGIQIRIMAKREAEKWDVLEDIYFGNQVDNARGVQLDRVLALAGFTRLKAQKSIVVLTFAGTPASPITTAMIVQTPQGVKFQVTVAGDIGGGGTVDLQARAIDAGLSGNVADNSITEINTPAAGVDTVNNADESLGGTEIETDDEFLLRFKSDGQDGNFSPSLLQEKLINDDAILFAKVFQNTQDFQVGALPGHAVNIVVEGGTPTELFDIFKFFVPMGIETVGLLNTDGLDDEGVFRSFNYDNPTNVDIFVTAQLQTDNTILPSVWVDLNEDDTKRKIIAQIGGTFGAEVFSGQQVGDDVEAHKVVAAISDSPQIIGDIIVDVSRTSPPSGARVDLLERERGRTDEVKVILLVT